MPDPAELSNYLRYLLQTQLSAENGAHTFEHICREVARKRIASNVLPATGPVSSGGDGGRDFETYRSYLIPGLDDHGGFVALVSKAALAFACTLQTTGVSTKFKADVQTIVDSGAKFDSVYAMCAVNVPIGRRQKIIAEIEKKHGVELIILDGQYLGEQLADPDLYWVARTYLKAPAEMAPPNAVTAPVVEDRSTAWNEPPELKQYEEMKVGFLESEDDPDSFQTVAEIIARQRATIDAGDAATAFEALSDLALDLYLWGLSGVALEVIDELRELVPTGTMSPVSEAWLAGTEGNVRAQLGQPAAAVALWEQMLAVGERLEDQQLQATALQNLASAEVLAGHMSQARALIHSSADLMQKLDQTYAMAQLLNNLALVEIDEDNLDSAAELLAFNEEIARQIDDPGLLSSALGNQGIMLARQGQFVEAEARYRESLKIARRGGSPLREVQSLQNLGAVCTDQQRLGDAMRWYRKGLRVAEAYRMPAQIEVLHKGLGTSLHLAGRDREAIAEFDAARNAAWGMGDRLLWAESTMRIAGVYLNSGRGTAAVDPLTRAAKAWRELGDFDGELNARENLSVAYRQQGETEAAVAVLQQSLQLVAAADHSRRAQLYRQAGLTCLDDFQLHQRAAEFFESAAVEDESLGPSERAENATRDGFHLRDAGSPDLALKLMDRAVSEAPQTGPIGDYRQAAARSDRAVVLAVLRRYDDAREDLCLAIEAATDSDDQEALVRALANLAEVERSSDNAATAVSIAERAVALARKLTDPTALTHSLGNLAISREDIADVDGADEAFLEMRSLSEKTAERDLQVKAVHGLARIASVRGAYADAARLYGEAVSCSDDGATLIRSLGERHRNLSLAGDRAETEDSARELLEAVQASESFVAGMEYFAYSAIIWIDQEDTEFALSLLATSVRLAGAAVRPTDDPDIEFGGYEPLITTTGFVRAAGRQTSNKTDFYAALLRRLDDEPDLADGLRQLLEVVETDDSSEAA